MVQRLPAWLHPDLLVGPERFSDAGIYRIAPDIAIVQSVDFFPPVVDDPYIYGQIAAANAISDIYAMGGQPRTALNIVGFPDDELDLAILEQILAGGAERMQAAGVCILGGHSVRDREIKYGLAVTGVVHPERFLTNAGAQPGDVLVLTKALGTGFITTANRAGECPSAVLDAAIASMIALNEAAGAAALAHGVHAATDITGFGLAGHACEMAEASSVTLEIDSSALVPLPGAIDMMKAGHYTRANKATRKTLGNRLAIPNNADAAAVELLFDPQTSGGLLLATPPDKVDALMHELLPNAPATAIIGRVIPRTDTSDIALQLRNTQK